MSDDIFLFVAGNIFHILFDNSDRIEIFYILQVYLDRGHRIPFKSYEDFNKKTLHNGIL